MTEPGVELRAPVLDGGLTPTLLRHGELTVFLARLDDRGRAGRRVPVATLVAPALLATGPAPSGWAWVLGPGLGSIYEEATTDSDDALVAHATAHTGELLGDLLRPFALLPPEQVVRLGPEVQSVPAGGGSMVEATAWVRPLTGELSLTGIPLPAAGTPVAPRLVVAAESEARAVAHPIAQAPVSAQIAGVEWLFDVAAAHVVGRSVERERVEAEQAHSVDDRSRKAELRALRLLAEELRARPEPVIPDSADSLVISTTRVLAAKQLASTFPGAASRDARAPRRSAPWPPHRVCTRGGSP